MLVRRLALLLPLTGIALPAAGDPIYTIKDLTPAGYTSSVAYDVNSAGDAVGVASRFVAGSPEEAYFIYDAATGVSTTFGEGALLPRDAIFRGSDFRRAAINDSGHVVGSARFVGGATEVRGFVYDGVTAGSLGTLFLGPGTGSNNRPASDALDINDAGVVVGTATSGRASGDNRDIYTATSAPVSDIDGDLTAATRGDTGRAINASGVIGGSNEASKATLFSGAGETEILAGTSAAADSSSVADVNDAGDAVGSTSASASFYYDASATTPITFLPNLGTGSRVFAKALNESGGVVGWADRNTGLSGQGRGFYYDAGGIIALEDHVLLEGSDTPGLDDWGILRTAWGINDAGQIVGTGDRRFDGEAFPNGRAYLLTPIDETLLAGDYNNDGAVNAADYTVWRDKQGDLATTLPNDTDGGNVGAAQYTTWEGNFGATAGSAVGVPEPTTGCLVAVLAAILAAGRRRC